MDDRQEIRCYTSEKRKWRQASEDSSFPDLSSWMRHHLNKAAREQEPKQVKVFTNVR